jgi:hypothetical protein
MHCPTDTDIPTLLSRADLPPRTEPQPPVLTQIARDELPPTPQADHLLNPSVSVLCAQLRIELEQVTQKAMDEAIAGLRARLEIELPALIERMLHNWDKA